MINEAGCKLRLARSASGRDSAAAIVREFGKIEHWQYHTNDVGYLNNKNSEQAKDFTHIVPVITVLGCRDQLARCSFYSSPRAIHVIKLFKTRYFL